MALTNTHVQRLKRDLAEHSAEIGKLGEQQQALSHASALHKALVELGNDERLIGALGELYDRPELFGEAAQNPRGFLTSRGARLPRGAQIAVGDREITMELTRGRQGLRARWSRANGFSAEPLDLPLE
jgi:hypothetical protein